MNIVRPLVMVAILSFSSLSANQTSAQSPDDLLAECTRSIAKLTKRCDNAIAEVTHDCLPLIRRLLNAGQNQRARDVAERCINQINEILRKCRAELQERCERCADALVQMGAPNLARELMSRCRRAANHMQDTRDRAVAAIRGLF